MTARTEELVARERATRETADHDRVAVPDRGTITAICDFLNQTRPEEDEEDWYVPGMVGKGILTGLAGPPKSGKSSFALTLAASLALGSEFLGHYPLRPIRTLWLNLEVHEKLLRKKLRQIFGNTTAAQLFVATGTRRNLSVERVRVLVAEHSIELVVVDSLSKWWGITEENDNAQADAQLIPIMALARSGVGILLIHHSPKGAEVRATVADFFRGAGSIGANLDVLLALAKVKDAEPTVRRIDTDSRYDETPHGFHIRRVGARFEKIANPVAAKHDEERERVRAVLDASPQTLKDITIRVTANGEPELPEKKVRKRLEELEDRGEACRGERVGNAYSYVRAH